MEIATALTVTQQVEKALAFTETRAQVMALVEESTHITEITNTAGYQQCHAARMSLKNTRIAIQKTGKEARDDAVKFQKAVIAKEKELVDLIEPEESRLAELQDAVDQAKAREKAAKDEAERQAQEAIRARFDAVRALPLAAINASAQDIREQIEEAQLLPCNGFPTEVLRSAFEYEKSIAIAALKAALDQRVLAEEEAERIKAEREELARLRAQQEEMRAEQDRIAAAEHHRQAEARRAEEAREREHQEAIARAAREAREAEEARIDAERAEARKREDAERAEAARKLREEQQAAAAERARLDAERREAAAAARKAEIANADLLTAANDAVVFLKARGFGDELVTQKLESALHREPQKKRKAA